MAVSGLMSTPKRLLAAIMITLLYASPLPVAYAQNRTVVITNFKFGLVCGPDQNRRICFETKDVQVTNEGICTFNLQQTNCTWFGYSFDYRLLGNEVTLQCEWASSRPANVGNPTAELEKGASGGRYEIVLRSDDRHFFNPQYVTSP